MAGGKFGLVLLIGCSDVLCDEIDVHLIEQTSTILVARSTGIIEKKLINVNEVVKDGEEILIIYQGEERSSVIAASDGILKEYANSIYKGAYIDKGDVIAVVLSNDVKGVLIPREDEDVSLSFEAGGTYCCLNIHDYEFNVDILNIRQENDQTWYYFSIKDTSSSFKLLLNKNREDFIDFKFISKVEGQ
jgi:hypothetical protein